MKQAVLYARVSSKDQEKEGFSIPAQTKFLRQYADSQGFSIIREFVDIETAKTTGRKQFGEMVNFLRENKSCRVVLVEKTDRLYRNFKDYVIVEDLDLEIHLPKEGQIISKDAKSPAKFMHGIHVVVARNYIENLRDEVRKGMREKAEQGVYPSRPPLGYKNNKLERTIEIDDEKAPLARTMFELYGTGDYSLSTLRTKLKAEFGKSLAKGYLERLLKNPFYRGVFIWEGKSYPGTHAPLVAAEQFERVQLVFRGHNKPKYRKHDFAFRGLLHCAYDDCLVTAESKKGKYTYYHCTGHRGKCSLPYFREEELGDRLGGILKDIYIPDPVLAQLEQSLLHDQGHANSQRSAQIERMKQRLVQIRRRREQAYLDKLDGKISEEFWTTQSGNWTQEEQQVLIALQGVEQESPERILNGVRILELANKAYFLYVKQTPTEQAKLLNIVLSNCSIDASSLYPTYRKPFDVIFRQARNEEWRARRDSNPRPSA